MHPGTKQSFWTICIAQSWARHRPSSPRQSASEDPGFRSLARGWTVEISLSTPQPPELHPEYWARTAPRSMGNIFFAPISTSLAPRRSLALLGHVRRTSAPPPGILPAWKRAAARHMATSLAPEAPGNLDMLAPAADRAYRGRASSERPPGLNGPQQSLQLCICVCCVPSVGEQLHLFWRAVDSRRRNTALLSVGSVVSPHRQANAKAGESTTYDISFLWIRWMCPLKWRFLYILVYIDIWKYF